MPSSGVWQKTLLLLALTAQPGCWWMHQQAEIETLDTRVEVSQVRAAALERAILEYEDRLSRLEESIRVAGADQAQKLENMDQVNVEVNRLRGQNEELRFELDQLQQHFEEMSVDMDRRQLHDEMRLRQLEKFLGVTPPPLPTDEPDCDPTVEACNDLASEPDDTEPSTAEDEPVEMPDTAVGKLDNAVEHMTAGRHKVGRAILERAVADHRGDPMMDEIRYRLAETWFNEKKFNKAMTAFQTVIDNHPKSDWAPWSMVRQGDCLAEQENLEMAEMFYQATRNDYPRSDAAKQLKELGKGGG